MTTTDLVYSTASLDQRKGYAQAIASAGDLLPKSLMAPVRMEDGRTEMRPSPGKVLLIAETGNMLGVHPIAALNGINVIEGKPTIAPQLMRALIQRAGHKLRVSEKGSIEAGDYSVTVELVRADDPGHPFTSTWTPHRAARAGLCAYAFDEKTKTWHVRARSNGGKVLPWEAYTESLCLARASGDVARAGAPDVLMGVQYTPEELGGNVDAEGNLVDLTATAVDRTGKRPPAAAAPEPTPAAEPEPIDAEVDDDLIEIREVVDEKTGDTILDAGPFYDQAEADEWAAQIAGATELGDPRATGEIERDTLAGILLRARRAHVLDHLVDDPTRVENPITIGQYIEQQRDQLGSVRA